MVFRSCFARNPSSFSAREGSAVKSGTSPRLKMNETPINREVRKHVPTADDIVGVIEPGFSAHGLEDLEHAETLSATEVVCFVMGGCRAVVKDGRAGLKSVES